MDAVTPQPVSQAELLQLCAADTELFGKTFFPKAMRSQSPAFAPRLNAALENPNYRLLNLKVFRGGTKTTRLRVFAAKRIAYGLSRTILYVGASESHATRSIQWMRSQIEAKIGADSVARRGPFAETFDLRLEKKGEAEIKIFHGVDAHPIWLLGVGITGNIRGINFEDYRPDLILLDDVITDENAATGPARDKLSDLIMGAVANSLISAEEEPNAKLVMLQTPLDSDDASGRAEKSSSWHTESFGCWTPETEDLPIENQISSWEALFPSETLRKEKRAAIADNRYSVFAREMECKITQAERLSFPARWLKKYDVAPRTGTCVLSLDPVPPPSDKQLAKALKGKDMEAMSVVSRSNGEYYVLDYAQSKGHEPDWTANKMFEFMSLYRPQCLVISLVSAERYLKWYLEQEMARRRNYLVIKEAKIGGQSKFLRITNSLSGASSQGKLNCSKEHHEFILQYESYGIGYKGLDDLLESVANGVAELTNPFLELSADEYKELDNEIAAFPLRRSCP